MVYTVENQFKIHYESYQAGNEALSIYEVHVRYLELRILFDTSSTFSEIEYYFSDNDKWVLHTLYLMQISL